MKKIVLFTLLGMMALQGCDTTRIHYQRTFRCIQLEVDQNSQAPELLADMCHNFGPRYAGSQGATQAEDMAAMLFLSYGIDNVFFQPFSFEQWQRGPLELTILSKNQTDTLQALSLAYSPSAQCTGELVDVGNGLIEDYTSVNVNGKIAVFYLGLLPDTPEGVRNVHRSEKVSFAIAQGAIACLTINDSPSNPSLCVTGTASLDRHAIKIPAVNVSYKDGMELKEHLKNSRLRAQIKMENSFKEVQARNVVARMEGSEFPKETIVVGAHLDSWDISLGAIDNASGAVAVLDMARTFTSLGLKPKRTIDFVLFMAEEEGEYGSELYVEEAKRQNTLQDIRYMFNHDMSVNTCGFNLMGRYESEEFFLQVGEVIQHTDSTFTNQIQHHAYLGSDHAEFIYEGIPTFDPYTSSYEVYGTYHTPADTPEAVTDDMLKSNIKLSSMILYALSNTANLPAERFSPEQVRNYLIENELQEGLVISGEWVWDL